MANTNRDTVAKMLRTVYLERITRQFLINKLLLMLFQPQTKSLPEGEKLSVPLEIHAGAGGHWNSAGRLPKASVMGMERAEFNYAYWQQRISIADSLLNSAKGKIAATTDPLKRQIESITRTRDHDTSYDLYRDGSGLLADILSATATTFTVDPVSTRGMRLRCEVDVVLKASGSIGTGGATSIPIAVNKRTGVCTLLDGKTWADLTGAHVNANPTLYGCYRQGSYNDAIFGLTAAISESNPPGRLYGGIDRTIAGNEYWNGIVNALTPGTAPRFKLIADLCDRINQESDFMGARRVVLCETQLFNHLVEQQDELRRYNGEATTFRGWAKGIKFTDYDVVDDPSCPKGCLFVLTPETWEMDQDDDGHWKDRDGSILHSNPDDDTYDAAFLYRAQLICRAPNANGLITGLAYVAPS